MKLKELQNTKEFTDLLAIRNLLMNQSCRLASLFIFIEFCIASCAIVFSFLNIKDGDLWLTGITAAWLFLHQFFLDQYHNEIVLKATSIQEEFDLKLFGLQQNKLLPLVNISFEERASKIRKYFKKNKTRKLLNWYPIPDKDYSGNMLYLIGERCIFIWDSRQRIIYANIMLSITIICLAGSLIFSLILDQSSREFVFGLLIPIFPFCTTLFKISKTNREVGKEKRRIAEQILESLNEGLNHQEEQYLSRSVQDLAFQLRSKATWIPNVLYKIILARYEQDTDSAMINCCEIIDSQQIGKEEREELV